MSPDQIADLRKAPPRVRLWITYRGNGADYFDPVRITLEDGKPVEFFRGCVHEEGFSRSHESYLYDAQSGLVTQEYTEEGRDCDGRHEWRCDMQWPINGPVAPWTDWSSGDPVERPEYPIAQFSKIDSWQRDHSAEMAGY